MVESTVEWEWGCEECEFSCETEAEALAHCDAAKHSLGMRPVRQESGVTPEIPCDIPEPPLIGN